MTDDQRIKQDLEELQQEFDELKQLAGEYSEAAADEVDGKIRQAKKKIRRRSEELMDELAPIIEKYQDTGRVAVRRVEDKVIDNPLLALAVAFGAGLVIGKLLDDDRR